MKGLRFKRVILSLFTLLVTAWVGLIVYCIANNEYTGAIISLSTLVIAFALSMPIIFRNE